MTHLEKQYIENQSRRIRINVLTMIGNLGVGHIGGSLSIVDVLSVLYFKQMIVDSKNPHLNDRDRLVLSKGHAGPALYATLSLKEFFPENWLETLNTGGTNLPSHCDRNRTPGIDMTTGSLGQGLSVACGMALANRVDKQKNYVYAIIGDGETDEGQNWEAAMFASHNHLDHLIAFTDYNKCQIDGTTDDINCLGDITGKWSTFGWFTQRIDGHDVATIDNAIEAAKAQAQEANLAGKRGKPSMIILDTIKGLGADFAEGLLSNHNMSFDLETANPSIDKLKKELIENGWEE